MRLGVAAAVVGDRMVTGDVEVEGSTIISVGLDGPGSGLAVPGFIDVHVHGYAGIDFASCEADGYARVSREITATGVTAFRPSLMSLPLNEMMAAISKHRGATATGARVLGMHLEGPFLSPFYPGAHPIDCLLDPDLRVAEHLLAAGTVEHMTLAPELPGADDLVRMLIDRGVTVSLGHSDGSAAIAHQTFDRGARALTHVFNGSRPFRHRDPGIIGAALSRDDVFVEAILDGVHLSDEASKLAMRAAGPRLVAVTDAMAAAGVGDGTYQLGNQPVTVSGGVARLEDGTLASSVLTMDAAFRKLVQLGDDVVATSRATSTAPAELLGRPELGSLDPGTPADVVVLDNDYRVVMTLVDGVVHHQA